MEKAFSLRERPWTLSPQTGLKQDDARHPNWYRSCSSLQTDALQSTVFCVLSLVGHENKAKATEMGRFPQPLRVIRCEK
jgi:hypothetical protein